ncbi:sugar-binding domain-containing protein [Marihabitans asiaticum]|uniref:Transcriptional regulator n=1 Tax=Marihabitans asiaticum TaxID=415218 RepID=A0A560WGY9_9MICO|nr:sugar-binding domain-containing protein [Marihabitans asiaticum]TWD16755.1 transcriptional regulator [Marihabitans asiaticum]
MSTGEPPVPLSETERALCVAAARMHYLEDRSKTDIAEALDISRFKVARLLGLAREHRIVRIEIEDSAVDLERSDRLAALLGLDRAVVTSGDVAVAAADLLSVVLDDGDVLGLPWSRTVARMIEHLHDLPRVDAVQLTGAHHAPELDTSAVAIVRAVARASGGSAHLFFAPFVAQDAETAAAFARQAEVRAARSELSRVTHAVVAAGSWGAGQSTIYDAVTPAERTEAKEAGVVGEIAGIFLDASGAAVEGLAAARLVTLSRQELRHIPHVALLATGPDKAATVRAAVAGGLVETLVCDRALAQVLLDAT